MRCAISYKDRTAWCLPCYPVFLFISCISDFHASILSCTASHVSFPIQVLQSFSQQVIPAAVMERYWYRASRFVSALHALSASVACNAEPKYLSESVPFFLPILHIAHSLRDIRRRTLRIHDTDCRSLLVTSL